MKKIILVFIVLFVNNLSKAQAIKSFDLIKSQEDSTLTVYSLKVRFDKFLDEDKRWGLIKMELEKKHQIDSTKIIGFNPFLNKRPRTYLYCIKVAKK